MADYDNDPRLVELHKALSELLRRKNQNWLQYYEPYEKQMLFHGLGSNKRERMFMAGNQLGKTLAGAMEAAMHATGEYPEWWPGRRFSGPTRGWVSGITGVQTRDNAQRLLLGPLNAEGTGTIPRKNLVSKRMARGIADAVDTLVIKHRSGGQSQISFKAYEQGREKFQGESLDWGWADEEPPLDIYTEFLARLTARSGLIYLTATPLLGMSAVVKRFLQEPDPARAYVTMVIEEALHIPAEEREAIIRGYPEHEREARANGVPLLGSGLIFKIPESVIKVAPRKIPDYWPRLVALDFGTEHAKAAVFLAWDRDTNTIYIYDVWKEKTPTLAPMVSAVRQRGGETIPVVWPHDLAERDPTSGKSYQQLFKTEGLNMTEEHATFEDGGYSTEAGIQLMTDRFVNGTLKVFETCTDFFEEYRLYHRKKGLIVKEDDDVMSASRIGVMAIRHAKEDTGPGQRRREPIIADGVGEDGMAEPKPKSQYTNAKDMRKWMDRRKPRPRVARGVGEGA